MKVNKEEVLSTEFNYETYEKTKKKIKAIIKNLLSIDKEQMLKNEKIEYNFEAFLNIIKKNPIERSIKEIQNIYHFLEQTELKTNTTKYGTKKLIYFCSLFVEYVYAENQSILFKEGDLADSFYILLKGKLNVVKETQNRCNMNGEIYLSTLYNIHKKGNTDMALKTISANYKIFPVMKKDLKNLMNIVNLFQFKKLLSKDVEIKEYLNFLEKCDVLIDNKEIILLSNHIKDSMLAVYLNILTDRCRSDGKFNPNFYSFIEDSEERSVIIYDNEVLVSFSTGKVFGDFALDNRYRVRTATIAFSENSYLGRINQEIYQDFQTSEKNKILMKEIDFLVSNFFFRNISLSNFKTKYFYNFLRLELLKGTSLFKEKETCQKLYFIKEGEVELKLELSTIELMKLINHLILKADCFKDKKNQEFNNELLFELSRKRVFRFIIFGKKEVIGNEILFYGMNYFYDGTVSSNLAVIYQIDVKSVFSLFEEEKHCVEKYHTMSKNKIKFIIKQLYSTKENYIKYVEEKVSKNKSKKSDLIENTLLNGPLNFKNSIKIETLKNIVVKSQVVSERLLNHQFNSNNDIAYPKLNFDFNIPIKDFIPSYRSRNEISQRKETTTFRLKESELENIQLIKLHRSINNLETTEKMMNKTTRFAKFDDEKTLSLPKISMLCINDTSKQNGKSSIFDKVESLRSIDKINYDEFNLNERLNIPHSKLKELKNLKLCNVGATNIRKNTRNHESMKKSINFPTIVNKDGSFKHLFVLKENKKIKKL